VPLKKEEDGRIFPISDDGKDVVGVFEQFFAHSDRIQINFGEGVEEIQKNND
jgi:predicted flavoprotein YhiN